MNKQSVWFLNVFFGAVIVWSAWLGANYIWTFGQPPLPLAYMQPFQPTSLGAAVVVMIGLFMLVLLWISLFAPGQRRIWIQCLYALLVLSAIGIAIWLVVAVEHPLHNIIANLDTPKISLLFLAIILIAPLRYVLPETAFVRMRATPKRLIYALIFGVLLIFTTAAQDVTAIVVINLIAWALGRFLLEKIRVAEFIRGLEELVLALPLGLSILALLSFLLAISAAWYLWVVIAILSLLGWVLRAQLKGILAGEGWQEERVSQPHTFLEINVLLVSVAAYSVFLMGALAPETFSDAIGQHLAIPAKMAQEHRLTFWHEFVGSTQIAHGPTLYAWGVMLASPIAGKLQNFVFALLVPLSMFAFSKRFLSVTAAVWATSIWSFASIVGFLAITAYVDLMASLYAMVALYVLFLWIDRGGRGLLGLLGVFLGTLLAIKFVSYVIVVPIALVTLAAIIKRRSTGAGEGRGVVTEVAIFSACASLVFLPWVAWTTWNTGNPVFPSLNNVFRSPFWEPVNEMFGAHLIWGMGKSFTGWVQLPWNMVFSPRKFVEVGNIGPLLLAVSPLLFLLRSGNWPVRLLIVITALVSLAWASGIQYLRWFAIFLPYWALLGGYVITEAWQNKQIWTAKFVPTMAITLLLITFVVDTATSSWWYWGQSGSGLPFQVVLGRETKEDYLKKAELGYGAIDYLNKHYRHHRVLNLAMRDHLYPNKLLYGDPHATLQFRQEAIFILQSASATELWERLKRGSYTHLLINTNRGAADGPLEKRPIIYSNEFFEGFLKLEYAFRGINLYRIRDVEEAPFDPASQLNLAENLCVAPAVGSVTNCRIPIKPDTPYLLGFFYPPTEATVTVTSAINWLDEKGAPIDGGTINHPPGKGGERIYHAESAPALARTAVVTLSANTPGTNFQQLSFVDMH